MFHRHFGVNNVGIGFAGDHFVFCLARFGMTPNITAFTAYGSIIPIPQEIIPSLISICQLPTRSPNDETPHPLRHPF
jgi:hypothetical protein